MLKALTVRDFALVAALDLDLEPGLTVITGESGAGKSILLGALGLVVGERAASETVRPGCQRAEVTAEFDLSAQPAAGTFLVDKALEDPDHPQRALVRRVVNRDGGSRAFINSAAVTLAVLREFAGTLVEIHGQHAHQRLDQPGYQLQLLDEYGVDHALLAACRSAFRQWRKLTSDITQLQAELASSEDRASLLTYQVDELAELAIGPGEFEQLESDHRRLSRTEELRASVARTLAALDETGLGAAERDLTAIEDDHPNLQAAKASLAAASDLLTDVGIELRGFADSLTDDPATLAGLEARLGQVLDLARKHRVEPDQLHAHFAALRAELEAISTDRGNLDVLVAQGEQLEDEYRSLAAQITAQRHAAADGFATAVSQCMRTLGIRDGALSLRFADSQSEAGMESVEFDVQTNPKYPAAPISKIASGGERARIGLAIRIVGAERSALPCLVLDEADVGVGGTTADVVGRLLRELGRHAQVLCVTHAPQVAALGDQHLRVEKSAQQDTEIQPLNPDGRVAELARMLAGAGVSDESREYARTLLRDAGSDGPVH